jgi:HAD superfamily hydrolase (TIGR01509 family)
MGMASVRVRGIIFDFDGVLVDSEPIRFKAGVQALAEIGITLTWERFLAVWLGRTDQAGLREILGDRYAAERDRVVARRNALYEEWMDEVPPYADAVALVRQLPHEIRLAVATGSRRIEVERILTRLGLAHRFRAIVAAEDYHQAKPAPDPFIAAARDMDLPPASCLVVEDSPAGVTAGQAAAMPVLAVDRGRVAAGLDRATWVVASLDRFTVTPEGEVVVRD